jgi:hypothetical protein
VAPLQQIAVPAQDRVRPYQQPQAAQLLHRQAVEQTSEEEAVLHRESGPGALALQELVPQDQDLGLHLAPGHRQQAYEGERVRDGEVGQTQQHGSASSQGPHSPTGSNRHRRSLITP